MGPAVAQAAAIIASKTCLELVPSGRPERDRTAGPYEIVLRAEKMPRGTRAAVNVALLESGADIRSADITITGRILHQKRARRRDIVLHELMHSVGAVDSSATRSVMYRKPVKPYSVLSRGDARTLQALGQCSGGDGDCAQPDAMGIALGLHGAGGVGASWDKAVGWSEAALRHGLLPLTPTAPEEGGRIWDINPGSKDLRDLESLIDETVRTHCIDTDRIYVGGHSMGAMATSVLAWTSRRFAAAAPVAGLVVPPGTCRPGTSLFAAHSADDTITMLQGDVQANLYPVIPLWARTTPRDQAIEAWARVNDCRVGPWRDGSDPGPDHMEPWREQLWDCPDGTQLRWRVYEHMWHGIPPGWADSTMEFFSSTSR